MTTTTAARFLELEDAPIPSPFPEGWYFIETRDAIEKAGLLSKMWMGEEIIAWSDGPGVICVAEAHCPHLGANLSPEMGGRIVDGCLVCPFHGFTYDATGQCISTPYTNPPPTARLRKFHIQEHLGLIFAWWGMNRRPPQWSLPDSPTEQDGWSSLARRSIRFAGHPQETTENSVDYSHLNYVHGFGEVKRTAPLVVEGHRLESRFDFQTQTSMLGLGKVTFDVSATTLVYGLGFSLVEIREHTIGMDSRLWVLSTPIDGTKVEMTLFSQVKNLTNPKRFIAGLGFLPAGLRTRVMNRFLVSNQLSNVEADIIIWENKRYRNRPRLFRLDGDIMPYRKYCAQFYPDVDAIQKNGAAPNGVPEAAEDS